MVDLGPEENYKAAQILSQAKERKEIDQKVLPWRKIVFSLNVLKRCIKRKVLRQCSWQQTAA